MPSFGIMLWKRACHKYVILYTYTMCKALYQNTIFELGIASSFSGMGLNTFWKRALRIFVYLYMSSYILYMLYSTHIYISIHSIWIVYMLVWTNPSYWTDGAVTQVGPWKWHTNICLHCQLLLLVLLLVTIIDLLIECSIGILPTSIQFINDKI